MGQLRELSVSQQIGLLFVVLFGLLSLVTVIAFTRTLRGDRSNEQIALHVRFRRDLRAAWIGAVLAAVHGLPGLSATVPHHD